MSESMQGQQYDYSNETINNSLLGMVAVHTGLSVLENCRAILRKDYRNMSGKVKIISGGKAENELAYTKFVGPGMLTAAILGYTFTAPTVDNILRVIEEIGFDCPSGVLLIVQNYAEYPISFTVAKLHAEAKGYNIRLIVTNNNCMLQNFKNATEERGFLPMLYVYKIAGAMSEEGKSIDEIYSFCNCIVNSGEIAFLEIEYTNIIRQEYEAEIFSNLAELMYKCVLNLLNTTSQDQSDKNLHERKMFCVGHEVAIMINNFGRNQIETNAFVLQILKQTEICGLNIKRIYVNTFVKSLDLGCFHVCFLNLSFTPVLIKYLDFATSVPGWPKVLTLNMIGMKEDDHIKLTTPRKYSKNDSMLDINLQGPTMTSESGHIFLLIISMACKAIIACTKQLNAINRTFKNGDYGTSLARGAKTIEAAIQEGKILGTNPFTTFLQISRIIERTVGGSQGGLYSLFFRNLAEAFSKYQSDEQITVEMWLNAFITANRTINQLKTLSIVDQTLLRVLVAIQVDLTNALNKKMNPIDAFGVAVKTAENFSDNFIDPNPESHAVGIWMRAAYEGIKLKFTHSQFAPLSMNSFSSPGI